MQSYKTDVAVLILFFNRPDHLGKVFDEVRKARPSKLFLYQDGPRGKRDMPGIEACRRIVENIDWECDVQRLYQERNYGCDPSEYISQKWAFSFVDKCIVHLDDCGLQPRGAAERLSLRLSLYLRVLYLGMGVVAPRHRQVGARIPVPRRPHVDATA